MWWLWLSFMLKNKLGQKSISKNVSESNFWADRIREFSFLQDYWSPLLLYPFSSFFPLWSHLPFYSLHSFPLSCFLWEVNCKWPCFPPPLSFSLFPLLLHFQQHLMPTQETRWFERKQRNRRMLWRGKWREKKASVWRQRGVSKPLMDLIPYKNAWNTRSNRTKYKYTDERRKSNTLIVSLRFFLHL